MVKIKELEEYFEKSLNGLITDNDIVEIASDLESCFTDYVEWEKSLYNNNVEDLKEDFNKWVETCSANDLLASDLQTYQRHFKLENGKYYYLNSYI